MGVNKIFLVGHLGHNASLRKTESGAVARVALATSETWKDKDTGDKQERTEWHRIVFFGRLAKVTGEYLKKGMPVYVGGRLQTRKWQDKDGNDRYTTEIVASEMQMLGSRTKRDNLPAGDSAEASEENPEPMATADDFDDEIPF